MNKSNEINNERNSQALQIWCCDNCRAIHFKAGNVLLNFSKEEFAELTYNINGVFQEQFGNLEFYNLINLLSKEEEVLLTNSVS